MDIGAWAEMDGVIIWKPIVTNLKKLSPKKQGLTGSEIHSTM